MHQCLWHPTHAVPLVFAGILRARWPLPLFVRATVRPSWLPDVYSKIFRSYVFGPLGFWTMAPLRCAAKFNPFLSLDCAPRPPPWRNPRKGRDQTLPSGNLVLLLSCMSHRITLATGFNHGNLFRYNGDFRGLGLGQITYGHVYSNLWKATPVKDPSGVQTSVIEAPQV